MRDSLLVIGIVPSGLPTFVRHIVLKKCFYPFFSVSLSLSGQGRAGRRNVAMGVLACVSKLVESKGGGSAASGARKATELRGVGGGAWGVTVAQPSCVTCVSMPAGRECWRALCGDRGRASQLAQPSCVTCLLIHSRWRAQHVGGEASQ